MKIRELALTAAVAALTSLAGMILHFISPALVPFSLLPIFVLLSGLLLGPKYGALAMIVYIMLGLFGLPVFSSAPYGGWGYILKPSFGFLLGYIGAAFTAGLIYRPGSLPRAIAGAGAGLIIIHVSGLIYLYIILNYVLSQPTDMVKVFMIGTAPFIVSDLIKAGIAAVVGNEVVRRRKSILKRAGEQE